jgi:hypothetical protein
MAWTMVTTLVSPHSRASSTRCGRTTRTAMARTQMARCTSLTYMRTHSCSREAPRRRHQLQVQLQRLPRRRLRRLRQLQPQRLPPLPRQPPRRRPHRPQLQPPRQLLHQDPLQPRDSIPHQGPVRPHRLVHNGKHAPRKSSQTKKQLPGFKAGRQKIQSGSQEGRNIFSGNASSSFQIQKFQISGR